MTGAPGQPKLLFVVEQGGRIEVLRNGHRLGRPFLDISGLVSFEGERGLLSIAFAPDYAQSGFFYVYYTNRQGNIEVDELRRRSQTRAAANSRRQVIEIPHPLNSNHNGGQLQFLGKLLYIGTGDGGSGGDPPNNAQNRESLLGKLLRIDPRRSGRRPYTVPDSNPFVGRPGRDEIYSYGLRNPFRFSFDTVSAKSPRLVIGDVGQSRFEEVDYTTVPDASGANFGWDAFEGFRPYRDENSGTPDPGGTVKPIFAYPTGAAAARSSAATWSPTTPCAASTAATYTPTTATAPCAASSPTCAARAATAGSGSRSTNRAPSASTPEVTLCASLEGHHRLPRRRIGVLPPGSSRIGVYRLADQPRA